MSLELSNSRQLSWISPTVLQSLTVGQCWGVCFVIARWNLTQGRAISLSILTVLLWALALDWHLGSIVDPDETTLISIPFSCSGPKAGVRERCVWASCISLAFLCKKCLWLLTYLHSGSSSDTLDASEGWVHCPCQFQDNTLTLFSRRISCCPLCRPLRLYQ